LLYIVCDQSQSIQVISHYFTYISVLYHASRGDYHVQKTQDKGEQRHWEASKEKENKKQVHLGDNKTNKDRAESSIQSLDGPNDCRLCLLLKTVAFGLFIFG
jgi:hypothetical protein